MSGVKRWELHSVLIEEFQRGPRQGEHRPITLPAEAIPLSVFKENEMLLLDYLVPAPEPRRRRKEVPKR